MLKQGSFIDHKFRRLMIGNVISWTAYCLNFLIDAILGGSQLGETALTAVSLVSPLFFVVSVASYLFSPGFGVLYGKRNGEFDCESAYRVAGENMISAIALGILTASGLLILKEPFLSFYNCTGELYANASAYYSWLIIYAFVYPIQNSISYLLLADSDAFSILLGCILNIVTNTVLSYVLCLRLGIAGLGIATLIAAVVAMLGYCFHFLRKTNSVHFRFYFNWGDLKTSFLLSISRSAEYLFMALVDIIMNKVILQRCGADFIPAYSVINFAFSCFEIIGAVFDSGEGMLASFLGERNNYGIKNVMKITARATLIMSVTLTAILFFAAPYFPVLYGITSAEIASVSVKAARIMSFGALAFGVSYLGIEIYATLEKPGLSMFASFLLNFFCPLALSVPFAYLFGFDGVSVGMMLSSYLVVAVFSLIVLLKYGRKGFPLYLADHGEEVIAFDLSVDRSSISSLRKNVVAELIKRGYGIENVGLLIEEFYTRISEKNPGRKILSECTLLFGEHQARLVIRDNGKVFNFMDENNKIESLNAQILSSLLEQTKQKSYVLTTSFNRNGFVFEKNTGRECTPC